MKASRGEVKAYIILVNWRNPFDTIECVQSLMRLTYHNFQVVVCDNGSTDDSKGIFRAWAERRVSLVPQAKNPTGFLASSAGQSLDPSAAFVDAENVNGVYFADPGKVTEATPRVVFISIPKNLGFAGGNNVGLRYARERGDGGIYWLLNNDTVVDPESLSHIADKFLRDPGCGMVGATIYHYYDPLVIQYSCGATANHWLATVSPIVTPRAINQSRTDFEVAIESRIDYVSGACLAITPDFLDRAGFMDEGYFLYYEELDWAARIPPHLHIGYAADAIVYHKEGAAIGGKTKGSSRKSLVADRYASRSRLVFTWRWHPVRCLLVVPMILLGALRRFCSGKTKNGTAVLSGLMSGVLRLSEEGFLGMAQKREDNEA